MGMQKPTTEKKLAAYRLVIHEMIDNFNNRSRKCMYRFKRCRCSHFKNDMCPCVWQNCPLGE